MFTIAIVGRPNVGKSSLFNRLAGKRLAIVHDTPGVTRDFNETTITLAGKRVRLLDTAGYESSKKEGLSARMAAQTTEAIKAADRCILLLDAKEGITASEEML